MKISTFKIGIMLTAIAAFVIAVSACGSSPAQTAPSATAHEENSSGIGITSYYVRADGNDSNRGTSENAPFKTLAKALEAASTTNIKRITVIGTLQGQTVIRDKGTSPRSVAKVIDATGEDFIQAITEQIGYPNLQGSYRDPNPGEIVISGKPNASAGEKALLTNSEGYALILLNSTIRLEHIEISGCQGDSAVAILNNGDLTLAQGVKITRNTGSGVFVAQRSVLIMRDDAEISHNESDYGGGVFIFTGVGVMLDNALVAHNKAEYSGGIRLEGAALIMRDNASVSNNSAHNGGGGIGAIADSENGFLSRITITDNAGVTHNSARGGGGIIFQDELILQGNARITDNTATEIGGGVFGSTDYASITVGADVTFANNQAPEYPDTNFIFD